MIEIILTKDKDDIKDVKTIRRQIIINKTCIFSDREDDINFLQNVLSKDIHRLFAEEKIEKYYIYNKERCHIENDPNLTEYADEYYDIVNDREKELIQSIIEDLKYKEFNLIGFLNEGYASINELKLLVDEGKASEKEDGEYFWVESKEMNHLLQDREQLKKYQKVFGREVLPKCIYFLKSNYSEGGIEVTFIVKEKDNVTLDGIKYKEWINSDYTLIT